ncbi:MAG TPA: 16S rRNA (adenine(1518)-N(6)/adenine(1519)-N(6))-dimethyltransferase RsmA [Bacilli bacterium]|jgi:16S rRNA (adenine1518-N6/adenine1519-N6)-dimethyltransferase|nr:16S rRNA (adenine(1518)-N(6)/adenine(1519)-N(6))-dimethyltransferase RsmA [Bacilli bacterium]MDD3389080.1 16S rRNA (adenine(1518)-N(6)/adenine(1519)-N(6))-dimethyltransferase RsmA [Bacilli bacterium]MDD4344719.1 16S rRNA (adenine(1518)-N(6)/adenine(1519)-N(6))-dimethyltransferase RsmA [Bacilli bacterium]MDD4520836.1 16S rRNA (adenine(1518)-N(6)/adenine(1519)-N(6))-dimethyltransferase RsmA [Bacilli bacterium]MDY0399652.1 16S rRNA (adenine(1518)-N(6)/adenine(1519)-N(6))-dimethyltransferase Rsm
MPVTNAKEVNELMTLLGSAPLKRYGQNFLIDQKIIEDIIQAFQPQKKDNILEIGPGLGALTTHLVGSGAQVIAVEIDRKLSAFLQSNLKINGNLVVINQNILQTKLSAFPSPLRIISNLPYNITTLVIEKIIKESINVKDFLFMVQKEVIARLNAKVGTAEYGPLAIMLNLLTEGKSIMNIPREAFYPQPNVTSTIYYLSFTHLYDDYEVLGIFRLVKSMFLSRRKTIYNNLAIYLKNKNEAENTLNALGVLLNTRPEQLSPEVYLDLYRSLNSKK